MHALLCGAGHNLRMIMEHLRVYCALVGRIAMLMMLLAGATSAPSA